MSIEELLKQRYELIADFPECTLEIGTILNEISNNLNCYQGIEKDGYYSTVYKNLEKYPHLFKKLQWWEKRDKKDMPKFLKIDNSEIVKIEAWIYQGNSFFAITNFNKKEGYDMFYAESYSYLPATEEEYLSFINKA